MAAVMIVEQRLIADSITGQICLIYGILPVIILIGYGISSAFHW